tara:strand:- start:170 stop:805 length:636 start_codon:yes stop_codon:yes gene_type:complete
MYTLKEAKRLSGGGISNRNKKMPGYTYGLSAKECKTGAKLVKIPGSTCSGCYALKANYFYPSVKTGHARRLASIDSAAWVPAMIQLINHYEKNFFRWHDSGDIQTVDHLRKICAVAAGTPSIKHWIPTREAGILKEFKRSGGVIPSNLIIRLSATMINGAPGKSHQHSSTVHTAGAAPIGEACNASKQGGQCLECRACWNTSIKNISYEKH